jgi:hypothetical protein
MTLHRLLRTQLPLLFILATAVSIANADDARIFTEKRSDGGELKYVNDLPVLIVSGTPEEIGRQRAALTPEATKTLVTYPQKWLERVGHKELLPKLIEMAKNLSPQLSDDHRAELQAFAERSGVDRNLVILGNTLVDIRGDFGCSSLIVDAVRSKTGEPLFGRNLDFSTQNVLDKYGLVTVYRPKGKHAFASVGFPVVAGCVSGMNDAGLALAVHEIHRSADGSKQFNAKGMPCLFLFRRALEECTTIEEVEKLLGQNSRTTFFSLALCDRNGGAVLEATPETLLLRRGENGICACTNHFRGKSLMVSDKCSRYTKLMESKKIERLDEADVAAKLHEVNLGKRTVQTMLFEPASLRLHVAMGKCPSSGEKMKTLDLRPLFETGKEGDGK